MNTASAFEPTVVGALWRYRWLVLAILGGSLLAALFFISGQSVRYQAVANLVVEDPRATALFDTSALARPERYVNNQASILVSDAVAQRAAETATEQGENFTPEQISRNLEISVFDASDEIALTFTANDPDRAVIGVNSVAAAYETTRLNAVRRSFDRAIEQLDQSILEFDQRLAQIATEIDDFIENNPARADLDTQYQETLARMVTLQDSLTRATGDSRELIRDQLDDVRQQLQTFELILNLERNSAELAPLFEEQSELIDRKEVLRQRRDELEVDSSLESTGIVLFSPALAASEVGSPVVQTLIMALLVGGLVATIVAYRLAISNRRFTDRQQPEQVLRARLLTEVPDFREEKVHELAVRTDPASVAAEAFRFIVPTLHRASEMQRQSSGDSGGTSFVVVSAASGDGKSVVAANLVLAAALQQNRVLAVDADFGDQQLSTLLSGEGDHDVGLADMVHSGASTRAISRTVEIPGFPPFDIVSRGRAPITAPEFFGSEKARKFFKDVRADYDVILIDAPPLLQVAYASSLVQYGDQPVVVVPHGSPVGRLEEVADRLDGLEAHTLGYIYTKAPLRVDLPRNTGSMADILGVGR